MIEVIPLQSDAWRRYRTLRLAALRTDPQAFGSRYADEQARPATFWQERLQRSSVVTLVARRGEVDVGLAVVAPWPAEEDACGLFSMWVSAEARGHGVGDALMQAALAAAAALGCERMLLDVHHHNTHARALYERWGFAWVRETEEERTLARTLSR
ncbi:MAG: GNAT family N-acetyltransferase [Myxococcales bacterium]|nr:GNAT family N-acetyltransferase [Myxococcales bacterium]